MICMFSCLIVDDEVLARNIIKNYCSHLPQLKVAGDCGNAIEAKNILQQQTVDILFLDIHMPVLDGLAFVRTLKQAPQIIFTTAYKEYAVNAFDIAACDYLVKPFSLERFIVAVDRATDRINKISAPAQETIQQSQDYFFIKTDGKIYKLLYADILYAEAKGNYTKIVTVNNVVTPNMSFSEFEAQLPAAIFARVHRSFILNKQKISHIEGNTVFIEKHQVPVSISYKDAFLKGLRVGN